METTLKTGHMPLACTRTNAEAFNTYIDNFIKYNGLTTQVKSYEARGIHLNLWQLRELIGEGNRGIGKTTLEYIQLLDRNTGKSFTVQPTAKSFIENGLSSEGYLLRELRPLHDFITEYYPEYETSFEGKILVCNLIS